MIEKQTAKQNLHTHTTFADGKDTPEELVLEAISRGFTSIGFSEHTFMKFSTYPHQMTVEKTEDYKKEIANLKEKYKGIIDIFCGLEFEFFSDLNTDGFDYLIGSVHYLNIDGKILGFDRSLDETIAYVKDNFNGNGLKFAEKYYQTVATLPTKRKFDIIGHFDQIVKNNDKGKVFDTASKEYLGYGYEAINSLKGKIPFFEVNTGVISRGYRQVPYPQIEFMKEFNRCGFGAVITSDCHNKNYLDCAFDLAKDCLISAGFKTHWILTNDGFKEIEL